MKINIDNLSIIYSLLQEHEDAKEVDIYYEDGVLYAEYLSDDGYAAIEAIAGEA